MRTTLVIPDPIFKRAKLYAQKQNKNLSEVFSEALDDQLTREEQALCEPRAAYKVKPVSMGSPAADVSDRDSLYNIMDDE